MNVVVGYIDSPEGEAAIERAVVEARLRGGELIVVHSRQGGEEEHGGETSDGLKSVRQRLQDAEVEHTIKEYVRGLWRPVQDLINAAQDHEAGLIVIGIRSRSTTGKFLLGSNALDILRESPVPVLCVKRKGDVIPQSDD